MVESKKYNERCASIAFEESMMQRENLKDFILPSR